MKTHESECTWIQEPNFEFWSIFVLAIFVLGVLIPNGRWGNIAWSMPFLKLPCKYFLQAAVTNVEALDQPLRCVLLTALKAYPRRWYRVRVRSLLLLSLTESAYLPFSFRVITPAAAPAQPET